MDNDSAMHLLAVTLTYWARALRREDGDTPGAVEKLKEALVEDENEEFALAEYAGILYNDPDGFSLYDQPNCDMAETLYERAIENNADSTNLRCLRAYAIFLERIKSTCPASMDKAEDLYRRALRVAPESVEVLNSFASFLQAIRASDKPSLHLAEALLQKAKRVNPDDTLVMANYARLLLEKLFKFDEALAQYQKLIKSDPGDITNCLSAATILHYSNHKLRHGDSEGRLERAAELYRTAIKAAGNGRTRMMISRHLYRLCVDRGQLIDPRKDTEMLRLTKSIAATKGVKCEVELVGFDERCYGLPCPGQ
jgi:tetratricopeptide (TPR) repeat protein